MQATIGISGHCHIVIVSLFRVCRGLELPPIQDQLDDDRNQDGGGHHKQTGERGGGNHGLFPFLWSRERVSLFVKQSGYQTGKTGAGHRRTGGGQYGLMIVSGRAT